MNFDILNLQNLSDWEKLPEKCPYLTQWGLATLRNGLINDVKSIVIEHNYICKDHNNLYSNYYSKRFHLPERNTYRLHFFGCEIQHTGYIIHLEQNALQESYIGYSVIRNSPERCLGRTILDPQKLQLLKSTYLLRTTFSANLLGRKLEIKGFPYISQDIDVTVCAHSALWALCRYLSTKFSIYKELLPFDIVQAVGDEFGRAYPYRGMTYLDYSKILTGFGVYPVIEHTGNTEEEKIRFRQVIYTYLESGFPLIASYGGHVVVLVGHDLLPESPQMSEQFNSTEIMVGNYYVMDDNYFPYKKLPRSAEERSHCLDSIKTIVVPLPEKVFQGADKILLFAEKYLNTEEFQRRLSRNHLQGPYLKRIFLATSISYKRKMYEYFSNSQCPSVLQLLNQKLPHFIWIIELMTPESYKSRQADAVLLLDPTAPPEETADRMILFQKVAKELTIYGNQASMLNTTAGMPMYIHNLS